MKKDLFTCRCCWILYILQLLHQLEMICGKQKRVIINVLCEEKTEEPEKKDVHGKKKKQMPSGSVEVTAKEILMERGGRDEDEKKGGQRRELVCRWNGEKIVGERELAAG